MGMKTGVAAIVVGFVLALSTLLVLAFAPLRGPRVWGHWREDSGVFAQEVWREKFAEASSAETERFVSEVCGEPVKFRADDERFQTSVWADQSVVRHFFLRSSFASVVWVTVTSPEYTCSARFHVTLAWKSCRYTETNDKHGDDRSDKRPDDIECNAGDLRITQMRLLTRERNRSAVPPGIHSLMLGERVLARLEPGETVTFRVVAPDLGQHVVIDANPVGATVPPPPEEVVDRVTFSVERNGQPVELAGPPGPMVVGLSPNAAIAQGGGIFDITAHGPKHGTGGYCLVVTWNQNIGTTICFDLSLQAKNPVELPHVLAP